MASNDVIELGSSDEETEPAPKRRKPSLNAMVHIPGKFPPGVTATTSKNAKTRINPASILKGSIGQAVTVTKVSKTNVNPFANTKKLNENGNLTKSSVVIKPAAGMNVMKPAASAGMLKRNIQIPIQRNADFPGPAITVNTRRVMNPTGRVIHHKATSKIFPSATGVNNMNIVRFPKPVPGKPGLKKPILANTSLPPGITIKRTTPPKVNNLKTNVIKINSPHTTLRMLNADAINKAVQRCAKSSSTEVPTVNLDDDEPAISSALGRQWYMRPEAQNKVDTGDPVQDPLEDDSFSHEIPVEKSQESLEKSPPATDSSCLEKQNNKEPDKTKYIEITIEDSPVKPPKTKKGFKVGAELAITIEDSPVKNTNEKTDPTNSDDVEEEQPEDRNSKKKLEYPKTVETVQVVEIEFEPHPVEEPSKSSASPNQSQPVKCKKPSTPPKEPASNEESLAPSISDNKIEKPKRIVECIDIVEIEESPIKPIEEVKISTPKKNKPTTTKPAYKISQQIGTIDLEDKEKDEFGPIYQSFINLCFHLENSDDMKKIVEKKIKAYYRQVPREYTESEIFTDMVSGKIMAMKASPEKMYLYIKDVVDELNLQRKLAKEHKEQPAKEKEEQQKFLYGEDSEFDAKRQRQIRKLEKTLKKLHRAIQKLEEQEVDFDDEEDSVYLLTESEDDEDDTSAKSCSPLDKEVLLQRYKERSVRVHAKLCQLTNTKMPSEARVQIEPRAGQPKGPAKRIEKWINKKVPIGTPLPFPDFHDVLRCVREANQEDKLGWNEADIMEEARDLFVRCGKKLQRRRQENEWRLAASRIPVDTLDPAEDSTELRRKLEENKRLAAKKETDVFNKYADRQNQLNLEAVEIGDKEAEESPVESDEEELVEVTDSLTDKEKRKERLKRLIQEKSKVSDVKGIETGHLSKEGKESLQDNKKDSNETEDNEEDVKKDPIEADLPVKEPPISNVSNKESKDAGKSDSSGKSKDGDNKVDSDVDELHLLEKLYSENEYNSVVGSSDTGSPIAISDASSSDEKRTKKTSSDVISIENSSYSESEEKLQNSSKETEAKSKNTNKMVEETGDVDMETDNSVSGLEKISNKTSNEECNGFFENILLAASDEADEPESRKENTVSETCINLRDDSISIGETLIVENRDLDGDSEASKPENSDKNTITDGSSIEDMEIGPTEIISEGQSRLDDIVETVSVESFDEGTNTKILSLNSPEGEGGSRAETTNINSAETIEDDDAETDNIEEILLAKSVENVNDENVNEPKVDCVKKRDDDNLNDDCEKSVNTIENETMESSLISLIDTQTKVFDDALNIMENVGKNKQDTADTETDLVTKDDLIQSSEDILMEVVQNVNQTENSNKDNEKISVKESEDINSTSKPMETSDKEIKENNDLVTKDVPMQCNEDILMKAIQTHNTDRETEKIHMKETEGNNTPEAMEVDSIEKGFEEIIQ